MKTRPLLSDRHFYFVSITALTLLGGCTKKDAATTAANTDSGVPTLVTSLEAVSAKFAPKSLTYDLGNNSHLDSHWSFDSRVKLLQSEARESSDPCAAVGNDLFACQPVLLRLYIALSKTFFDMGTTVIDQVGTQMGAIADGASGTVNIENHQKVVYSKTDSTHFTLLLKDSADASMGYIKVDGTSINIKMNIGGIDSTQAGTMLGLTMTYTDANNWTVDSTLTGMTCNPDDPRAPKSIWVHIAKADALWKGKAIIYNPIWLDNNPTCSTAEADNISMNFYTNFVGNDTAAKAGVFLIQRNVTSLASIDTYAMSRICDNYMTCNAGTAATVAAFTNPFCNPQATNTATWGDDCTSTAAAVGAADYGLASDWIVPSVFATTTVTIPDSI